MRTTKTTTSLLLALLLTLVMGLATVATAQDDSSGPDDSSSEDDGPDDSSSEDDGPDDSSSEDDGPDDSSSEDDSDDSSSASGARVFGADRFATSVAISQYEFRSGADEVYLARADNFADAVAAGSLKRGPVLLVPQCGELPTVIAEEIARLDPDRVVALGGPSAICDDMITLAIAAADAGSSSGSDDDSDDGSDDSGDDGGVDDDAPATETTQTSNLAVGEEAVYDADQAGTVTIRRTDAGVELVSATPNAGWQIRESDPSDPGEAEVSFTDGTTRVDVKAEVEDGQVRVRIRVRAE